MCFRFVFLGSTAVSKHLVADFEVDVAGEAISFTLMNGIVLLHLSFECGETERLTDWPSSHIVLFSGICGCHMQSHKFVCASKPVCGNLCMVG